MIAIGVYWRIDHGQTGADSIRNSGLETIADGRGVTRSIRHGASEAMETPMI
jgi:hypothetical protein